MSFTNADISKITSDVFDLILGLHVRQSTHALDQSQKADSCMTSTVYLTGAWEGTVAVHCTTNLARHATSVMFGVESERVTEPQLRDTLGELANMISGNLKTLLPAPSFLSLPCVAEGLNHLPQATDNSHLHQLIWDCNGQLLMVTVIENSCYAIQ